MTKVLGKNVSLYVYRSGTPTLTVCATNVSRRESAQTIARLVRGAGRNRIYSSTLLDSTVTLEGVRTLDGVDWQIDDFEIGATERIIIIYEDSLGNSVAYDGNVVITGIDDSNGAADFSTYTVTMLRSGAWTVLHNVVVGGINYLADGNGDLIYDGNGNPIIVP
jgi:hypothetical protein